MKTLKIYTGVLIALIIIMKITIQIHRVIIRQELYQVFIVYLGEVPGSVIGIASYEVLIENMVL